jgi:hypothetical protein
MKQRRPIRAVSPKQKDREREFEVARRIVLARDRHRCQFYDRIGKAVGDRISVYHRPDGTAAATVKELDLGDVPSCDRTMHVHHIKSRRARESFADEANLVTLCATHHEWVHRERAAAVELGLLEHVNQVGDD